MKKITKKNIEDILALTPMQEGILFHYLKRPGSGTYFEQLSLAISGEIELESLDQVFEKPDWIGKEVTADSRYYNANLVNNPYSNWKDGEVS